MTRSKQLQQARRRRRMANERKRNIKLWKRLGFYDPCPPVVTDDALCPEGKRRDEPCDCILHQFTGIGAQP